MRQAKDNSIMHKIQLKWTKISFNKVAKQQIFIEKNIRLKAPISADKEEVNFRTETTYLKILKAKYQLQASLPSHDSDYLATLAT